MAARQQADFLYGKIPAIGFIRDVGINALRMFPGNMKVQIAHYLPIFPIFITIGLAWERRGLTQLRTHMIFPMPHLYNFNKAHTHYNQKPEMRKKPKLQKIMQNMLK